MILDRLIDLSGLRSQSSRQTDTLTLYPVTAFFRVVVYNVRAALTTHLTWSYMDMDMDMDPFDCVQNILGPLALRPIASIRDGFSSNSMSNQSPRRVQRKALTV